MPTWGLDDSGDLAELSGRPVPVSGAREIGQRIQVRLRTFKGEWFRDRTIGTDWYTYGLGKRNPDLIVLRSAIGLVIRQTTGVIQILKLTLTLSTARQLTITANVQVDAQDATQIRLITTLIPPAPPTPTPDPTPAEYVEDFGSEVDINGIETSSDAPYVDGITLE